MFIPIKNFNKKEEHCLVEWMVIQVTIGADINATLEYVELSPAHPTDLTVLAKNREPEIRGYSKVNVGEIEKVFGYNLEKGRGSIH